MNKLIRFYPNADLRNSHAGLATIAEKDGLAPKNLKPGQFIVFVNSRKTALKLYAPNHIVAHYKSPTGKIDLRVLSQLPTFFNGTELNYSGALEATLTKALGKAK